MISIISSFNKIKSESRIVGHIVVNVNYQGFSIPNSLTYEKATTIKVNELDFEYENTEDFMIFHKK